jgi:hypothetical protein
VVQQAEAEHAGLAGKAERGTSPVPNSTSLLTLTGSRLGLDLLNEKLDELPYAEKRDLAALAIELSV